MASWFSGFGWLVLMIQSALPAVSALVLSNNTRWVVAAAGVAEAVGAACICAAAPAVTAVTTATPPIRPRRCLYDPSIRLTSVWG